MRSLVSAVFFLAMVPFGFMASEDVQPAGHRTSNSPGAAETEAQQQTYLRQDGGHAREQDHRGLISSNMATLRDLHNDARCLHKADPLTYSNKLANSAKSHAQALKNSCGGLLHSAGADKGDYGENTFFCASKKSGMCYTPERAMKSLYENEVKANNVKDYGKHATQILWKSTTQLGCAEAICKTGSWYNFYLVCQYNPAGNLGATLNAEVGLPTGKNC